MIYDYAYLHYLMVKFRVRHWEKGVGYVITFQTRFYLLGRFRLTDRFCSVDGEAIKRWIASHTFVKPKISSYPVRVWIKRVCSRSHTSLIRLSLFDRWHLFRHRIKSCGHESSFGKLCYF